MFFMTTFVAHAYHQVCKTQPLITRTLKPLFRQFELLRKENEQLQSKLKLVRDRIPKAGSDDRCQHKKREKHLSPGGSPWLPFDSKEEAGAS